MTLDLLISENMLSFVETWYDIMKELDFYNYWAGASKYYHGRFMVSMCHQCISSECEHFIQISHYFTIRYHVSKHANQLLNCFNNFFIYLKCLSLSHHCYEAEQANNNSNLWSVIYWFQFLLNISFYHAADEWKLRYKKFTHLQSL